MRSLYDRGHNIAVAMPNNAKAISPKYKSFTFQKIFKNNLKIFRNNNTADILHVISPRSVNINFLSKYLKIKPTPFLVFLEDNETYITKNIINKFVGKEYLMSDNDYINILGGQLTKKSAYISTLLLADKIVTINETIQNDFPIKLNFENILPGIDLEFFSNKVNPSDNFLKKYQLDLKKNKYITFPGGINYFTLKPAIELIKGVNLYNRKNNQNIQLIFSGPDGPEREKINDFVKKNNIQNFRYIGFIDRKNMPNFLSISEILIQPGKQNDFEELRFPGKIAEYLAMGKPVILPNTSIARKINLKVKSEILLNGNSTEIAEKLRLLLSDNHRLKQISMSSRKYAELNFDIRSTVKKYELIYFKIRKNTKKFNILRDISFNNIEVSAIKILLENYKNKNKELLLNLISKINKDRTEKDINYFLVRNKNEKLIHLEESFDRLAIKYNKQVENSRNEIEKLQKEIQVRDNQIHGLLTSKSWKITKPIRIIYQLLKLIRSCFVLIKFLNTRNIKKIIQYLPRDKKLSNTIKTINHYAEQLNNKKIFVNRYNEWIQREEDFNLNDVKVIRNKLQSIKLKTKFSICMPVFNPNPIYLKEAIDSVINQIYQNWELCIADDASTNPEIRKILKYYESQYRNIKVIYRKENGHISKASNSAIRVCTGDYIGFLDHDDKLSPHALLWVAAETKNNPRAQIIYSDEDKINEAGNHDGPYFKPNFSPELFYSHNLITHFAIYKKNIIKKIKGFRSKFDGAQDYDLALRALSECGEKNISHIPKILYHWRQHSDSTALDSNAKPYAMLAGEKALNEYFNSNKIPYKVKYIGSAYKLLGKLPKSNPKISIIIPSNNLDNLKICINSIIKKSTYKNYEIVVIANNKLNVKDVINIFPNLINLKVLNYKGEFNYSKLNNFGAKKSKGKYLLFLNDDTEVISSDWLEVLLGFASIREVGAVGLKLIYKNNTVQHGGIVLGINNWAGHAFRGFPKDSPGSNHRLSLVSNFSAVTAACLMISKVKFDLVRGFNEKELKVACNDVDFCLSLMNKGYRNVYCGHTSIYHYESISRGYEDTQEKKKRFDHESSYVINKWRDLFKNDPHYNPNLTDKTENFDLADKPRIEKIPQIIYQ